MFAAKGVRDGAELAWSESVGGVAEDPFRGLRAGPVTFSPFLFFLPVETPNGFASPAKSKKKQQSKAGAYSYA
jgi:hypothetical protein